jgi:tetratricopeptide (TPR) repeat protein
MSPPATSPFDAARQHFVEGIGHYEAGRYAQARVSFEASLALLPGRVSTLGNLGATLVKLGQAEAALVPLGEALAIDAHALDALSHKGLALADLGRYPEALACHDAVLRQQADHIPAAYQRSLMLKQLGRYQEAVDATGRVVALDADNLEAWWLRAELLHRLGQHDAALAAFDRVLSLGPLLHRAWSQKAGLLKDLGRHAEALAAFQQALALGGDTELNGYFIASLTGQQAPSAPPGQYVAGLFDDYAEHFDKHLVDVLGYQAHRVLVENLQGVGKAHYRSALDLGCGTGLCGPLLRGQVNRLEGVDLSGQMLGKARALGVYDALVQADVAEHLQATDQRHDLLLSCDVFIYVGALEAVFAGAARVLEPGGVFCFSVETTDDAHDYRLMPSQRYAHSERYLRSLAASQGLTVVKTLAQPIRQDQQQGIDGLYVYLVKPAPWPRQTVSSSP